MSDWLYILNNNPLVLTFIAVIGLCLGSFYNVVIIRSLKDESIVFPASKCPHCEHPLYFWHNIPILSYLILRGKCYFCNEKISFQYPLVEFITMLFFVLSYMKFGISLTLAFSLIWLSLLLIMTVTDFKEKLVGSTNTFSGRQLTIFTLFWWTTLAEFMTLVFICSRLWICFL